MVDVHVAFISHLTSLAEGVLRYWFSGPQVQIVLVVLYTSPWVFQVQEMSSTLSNDCAFTLDPIICMRPCSQSKFHAVVLI